MECLLNRKPNEQPRYAGDHPCRSNECARCGWNSVEHERRLARGLTKDENGLRHFTKTKAGEIY